MSIQNHNTFSAPYSHHIGVAPHHRTQQTCACLQNLLAGTTSQPAVHRHTPKPTPRIRFSVDSSLLGTMHALRLQPQLKVYAVVHLQKSTLYSVDLPRPSARTSPAAALPLQPSHMLFFAALLRPAAAFRHVKLSPPLQTSPFVLISTPFERSRSCRHFHHSLLSSLTCASLHCLQTATNTVGFWLESGCCMHATYFRVSMCLCIYTSNPKSNCRRNTISAVRQIHAPWRNASTNMVFICYLGCSVPVPSPCVAVWHCAATRPGGALLSSPSVKYSVKLGH